MHPQLQEVVDEFHGASERLRALARTVPESSWAHRPDPDRWSISECVAHLNLTSEAYLPLLDAALDEATALPAHGGKRYRRDIIGWLLWRTMGPPVRFRTKTTAAFVPDSGRGADELVRDFERLQQEQIRRVERADGLALDRVRMGSPFDARVKYNVYSCLSILPRHQHRHLWQAEQVGQVIETHASG